MMRYTCDVQRKVDNIKNALIKWSEEHNPNYHPNQTDFQLWCSVNRLIGAFFPDWCDEPKGGEDKK